MSLTNDAYWDYTETYRDDDYDDTPERDEDAFEREQEHMAECHCGAYQFSANKGYLVQVADCVC